MNRKPTGSAGNVRQISSVPRLTQEEFEAEMMARIERLKQEGKLPTLSQTREDVRPYETSRPPASPTKKG